jgi:hypothetical protein
MQTSKPFLFQFYVKLCRCAITCETLVINYELEILIVLFHHSDQFLQLVNAHLMMLHQTRDEIHIGAIILFKILFVVINTFSNQKKKNSKKFEKLKPNSYLCSINN